MADTKYELLKRVSLFKGVSSNVLRRIARFASFRQFRRGESIFSENSSGECLYVLVSGRVKIYASAGSRSKTFALLDPGDFFGEMALLGEPTRSASARALLDTELLVLERRDFHRFLKTDAALVLTVLQTLCQRLRRADKEIEMLSFQNVIGRTAMTLCELKAKYGRACGDGTLIAADITQQELADLIGTAREMVTRVVARFRKMGALAIERATGRIIVLNEQKLKDCVYQ